jgi:hypothetical protein
MTTRPSDREALLELINPHSHYYDWDCGTDSGCACAAIQDYDAVETDHDDHLADVILPWLVERVRAAQEAAWGEGATQGWASSGEGWNGEYPSPELDYRDVPGAKPNPYRKKPTE